MTSPRRPSPAAIVSELHKDIVECRLEPGREMTEAEIAERFGVSKTPAREALRELASSYGYVIALAGRGYQVASITLREVRDVYDLMLRLLPGAAADAARGPFIGGMDGLDDLAVHRHVAGDRSSYLALQREHVRLLAVLGYAAGSVILGETLLRLLDRSVRIVSFGYPVLGRTESMAHDHRPLVQALRDGDDTTAARLVEDEVVATRDRVLAAVVELDVPTGPVSALPPR